MSSNDETFLESFIENISTLPHELRRNLELMKDLDKSCSAVVSELQQAQVEYATAARAKIDALPVLLGNDDDDNDDNNSKDQAETGEDDAKKTNTKGRKRGLPTTEELVAYVEDPPPLRHISKLRRQASQLVEEKVAIADQAYSLIQSTVQRLDKDLAEFETLLKGTGEFEAAIGGAKPDDLAAVQVTPSSPDWILAKVISHNRETGMYKLSDEDVESNKIFTLPESQVVVLNILERLSRGDMIYAIYPDTTSFYPATVVQSPRKTFVMVNFKDDGDEHGVTHDKAVLLKHVMRTPYNAGLT